MYFSRVYSKYFFKNYLILLGMFITCILFISIIPETKYPDNIKLKKISEDHCELQFSPQNIFKQIYNLSVKKLNVLIVNINLITF